MHIDTERIILKFRKLPVTVAFVLLLVPVFVSLSGCGKQEIVLSNSENKLASRTVTAGGDEIIYPDDTPSIPDGKVVWQEQNCAVCHAATGAGVPGKCNLDLTDKAYGRKQKPVDQYEFLWFGKQGVDHPTMRGKISRREGWDLVFYSRSLSAPPLSATLTSKEQEGIEQVFGSNCAVCHGLKGYGDGDLAHNMEPVPANFRQFNRFYDRSDDVLWDHIANGIKWEGMPNFLGKEDRAKNVKFDQEYIWKLVQYVRHFHESTEATIATSAPTNQDTTDNKK